MLTNMLLCFQTVIKEGMLTKQNNSFQRSKRRYFKLRGRTLYYAKTAKVRSSGRSFTGETERGAAGGAQALSPHPGKGPGVLDLLLPASFVILWVLILSQDMFYFL